MYGRSKGRDAWEDDHYDEDDYEEYEEDEEYDEEEDAAIVQKRAEAKKAEEAKARAAAAKKAAPKPKAEPAPKKTAAEPQAPAALTNADKKKIEQDNRKMNYDLSAELFGGVDIATPSRPDFKLPDDATFESFVPKSEADFELFAKYVGGHLAVSANTFHYKYFIKNMLKHALGTLQPSDIEDIGVGVNTIQTERENEIQAARTAAANIKTRADDYGGDFM